MSSEIFLTLSPRGAISHCPEACSVSVARVHAWIGDKLEYARSIFTGTDAGGQPAGCTAQLAIQISEILSQRDFNFQSRGRLTSQLEKARENLQRQLQSGGALKFFLLYNGGYRASPLADSSSLIFEPDQTELLLLYQVALLHEKIRAVYQPGIQFFIVINNGVGLWVNDIPLARTASYASKLRDMIRWLGAAGRVEVLVQSELPKFEAGNVLGPVDPTALLSDKEHRLVERFLGRECSIAEASHRHALYTVAEDQWAQDLSALVTNHDALVFRQVAHADMLSFRPFPGAAIRIQNGSLGFEHRLGKLIPKLITSETVRQSEVYGVPWSNPWENSVIDLQKAIEHNG